MKPIVRSTLVRWVVGILVGSFSAVGAAASCGALVMSGWHRDALLICLGSTWVLAGALAFLLRREVGRQILLGTMEAFVLALTAVACLVAGSRWTDLASLWHLRHVPAAVAWLALLGATVAGVTWAGLRSASVREAMRGIEGGRRTSASS